MSIGLAAFDRCTSLNSASFPVASSIEAYAFEYTGGTALTVTLGNTPPTVGYSMFYGVSESKTVTVRRPVPAVAAYTSTWVDAFKGKGNTYTRAR